MRGSISATFYTSHVRPESATGPTRGLVIAWLGWAQNGEPPNLASCKEGLRKRRVPWSRNQGPDTDSGAGGSGGIRTPDLGLMSPLLYP
jgi:hypothetical protein